MSTQIKIAVAVAITCGAASAATAAEHPSGMTLRTGEPAAARQVAVNAVRRRDTGCGTFVLISERPIQ
jgi:hypothetical protein